MATGAGDRYWDKQRLPSVLKHDLLRRYLPVFAGKTGSKSNGVVYLDGYAGRGRYEDGTPGSAERILQIAEEQSRRGIGYRLFFHETERKNYAALKPVVDEYKARGVQAEASPEEVIKGLGKVIDAEQAARSSSLHGDFRAACSPLPALRAQRPETSTDRPSRSATDPSVPGVPGASPLSPAGWDSRSVQAAGISRLDPSGSTTSNSAAPCRRMLPSTGNCRPSNGCPSRVSLTVPGCTAVTGRLP